MTTPAQGDQNYESTVNDALARPLDDVRLLLAHQHATNYSDCAYALPPTQRIRLRSWRAGIGGCGRCGMGCGIEGWVNEALLRFLRAVLFGAISCLVKFVYGSHNCY